MARAKDKKYNVVIRGTVILPADDSLNEELENAIISEIDGFEIGDLGDDCDYEVTLDLTRAEITEA